VGTNIHPFASAHAHKYTKTQQPLAENQKIKGKKHKQRSTVMAAAHPNVETKPVSPSPSDVHQLLKQRKRDARDISTRREQRQHDIKGQIHGFGGL